MSSLGGGWKEPQAHIPTNLGPWLREKDYSWTCRAVPYPEPFLGFVSSLFRGLWGNRVAIWNGKLECPLSKVKVHGPVVTGRGNITASSKYLHLAIRASARETSRDIPGLSAMIYMFYRDMDS